MLLRKEAPLRKQYNGALRLISKTLYPKNNSQTRVTVDFRLAFDACVCFPTSGGGRPFTVAHAFPLGHISLVQHRSTSRQEAKLGSLRSLGVVNHSFKTKKDKIKHLPT